MKSEIVTIDNLGNGFAKAIQTMEEMAESQALTHTETIELKILTEEMLSLVRSVTGEMQASFWGEFDEKAVTLHLTTSVLMDKEKRYLLLSSTSSRQNEAAKGLLGKLRDVLENAMLADQTPRSSGVSSEVQQDLIYMHEADPEWDRYEKSILQKLADDVRIAIRGSEIHMTVSKTF